MDKNAGEKLNGNEKTRVERRSATAALPFHVRGSLGCHVCRPSARELAASAVTIPSNQNKKGWV